MSRAIVTLITLICWLISAYKLRDLVRDRGNRPLRYLWLAVLAVTLALTVQPVAPRLDRLTGILGLARLTSNCLSLTGAAAAQGFLLYMTGDAQTVRRQVRRRGLAMGACVLVCVILFALTPAQYAFGDPHVRDGSYYRQTSTLAVAPYQVVYLLYLGWAMLQISTLSARYARLAARPLLRLGLWLIASGAIMGLGYVATKVLAIIAVTVRWSASPLLDQVVVAFYAPAILTILVGATIPSWGPRVGLVRLWNWTTAMRDVRRLCPLWDALYAVVPQIALVPPQRGLAGWWRTTRRIQAWRVRMTVEILDGFVLLSPWMSAATRATATEAARRNGLRGPTAEIVVEAATVAAAIRAHQHHERQVDDPLTDVLAPPIDASAGDQVARLCLVAHALHHSPVVSETLAGVETRASEPPTSEAAPPSGKG